MNKYIIFCCLSFLLVTSCFSSDKPVVDLPAGKVIPADIVAKFEKKSVTQPQVEAFKDVCSFFSSGQFDDARRAVNRLKSLESVKVGAHLEDDDAPADIDTKGLYPAIIMLERHILVASGAFNASFVSGSVQCQEQRTALPNSAYVDPKRLMLPGGFTQDDVTKYFQDQEPRLVSPFLTHAIRHAVAGKVLSSSRIGKTKLPIVHSMLLDNLEYSNLDFQKRQKPLSQQEGDFLPAQVALFVLAHDFNDNDQSRAQDLFLSDSPEPARIDFDRDVVGCVIEEDDELVEKALTLVQNLKRCSTIDLSQKSALLLQLESAIGRMQVDGGNDVELSDLIDLVEAVLASVV